MIVTKENPRWEELLTGKFKHQFRLASAAMMVSRCQRSVQGDPSPQTIKKNIDDLYAFFTKFEKVVYDDLNEIFQ
jgi:hypothetical protein